MKWLVLGVLAIVAGGAGYFFAYEDGSAALRALTQDDTRSDSFTEHEAGFEDDDTWYQAREYRIGRGVGYSLAELRSWERAPGPLRVGLQVGHLDNDATPEELSGLARNGAGATFGDLNERDTVRVITELVAARLEAEGIVVDVLPATVPPGYQADAFVSIHADGNANQSVSGFKIAGPRRDYSGRSTSLVDTLYQSYGDTVGLPEDPQVTRRMTAYYAFNWPRYEHAIHPFTPAAIVETGFLTNATDRAVIVANPNLAAEGIASGIIRFLAADVPPEPPPLSLTAPTLPLTGTIECAEVREERVTRRPRPCEASLRDDTGARYLLVQDPPIATSSLPYEATVAGEYMPVQLLDNYFWFHWEVLGLIAVSELSPRQD